MLLFYSTGFTMGLFMKMGNSEVGTAKGDEFGLGLVDFELILFIHVQIDIDSGTFSGV